MPRTEVRKKLLSAGYTMLFRRGFNATSVQDITEAAGVPKGSFYNHFESKEALAAEAVTLYSAIRGQAAQDQMQRDAAKPPLTRLLNHFSDLAESAVASELAEGCLLGNFSAELSNQSSVVRQRVAASLEKWAQSLTALVAEAQEDGAVPKDVPAQSLAASLVDAWEGALLRAKAQKSRGPLDQFLNVTFPKLLA